ncbi:MAG: hypothetical protein AAB288_04250, partial [Acidobacteriota bacterium]
KLERKNVFRVRRGSGRGNRSIFHLLKDEANDTVKTGSVPTSEPSESQFVTAQKVGDLSSGLNPPIDEWWQV